MAEVDLTSDSEIDDPKKITDAASCLDYLKRKEVFLYKMMNDPSHKAMLYFLEVLMNSEAPVSVEQLAARFSHKTFSPEMRSACGGGSPEGLKEFLSRYPSLFNVHANGNVDSVAIELPGLEGSLDGFTDIDGNPGFPIRGTFTTNENDRSNSHSVGCDGSNKLGDRAFDTRPVIHRQNKNVVSYQSTALMRKFKTKSTSSLSLISTPSNNSSSSGSLPYYRKPELKDNLSGCNLNSTSSTDPQIPRRGSNPVLGTSSRPGIYQPPFRKQLNSMLSDVNNSTKQCCDNPMSSNLPILPQTTCLHCHLIGLTCHHHHHHCPVTHLHHHAPALSSAHCLCAESAPAPATCCHHCASVTTSATLCPSAAKNTSNFSSLPPMERLTLETDAVRFFQQRLFKREERWVPIKSLAGHLSQASAEVRAVVGPQLEFRNFLLRHPHVFEVQGELVSIRDPFGTIYPVRKGRDRPMGMHASISTTNLSTTGTGNLAQLSGVLRNNGSERVPRPKSLILPNSTPFLSSFNSITNPSSTRSNFENRRSTHFAENFVTACYSVPSWPSRSGSTSSAPNTPTGHNQNNFRANQGLDNAISTNDVTSTDLNSCFTEIENSKKLYDSLLGEPNPNSLSISMSANEYRSVMFVRKVLDKRGGAPGQSGLNLRDLMQIVSTKAPETVQSIIGWTKVEFMEFLNKHPIFFEVLQTSGANITPVAQSNSQVSEASIVVVKNRRLEKMINIVITGPKPNEGEPRSLTNRCGRIFHVAKLWGIIDLGRHEHVFFDKSIFKHVDDLQKYFKIDELLYFNAVLAPKESRAKWRATQVWKECDREAMEKLSGLKSTSISFKHSVNRSSHRPLSSSNPPEGHGGLISGLVNSRSLDNMSSIDNEDTEADEEIEDIVVDATSSLERPLTTSVHSQCDSQRDSEFALDGDEDVGEDQPYISELARREGLNLINDIKFVGGETSFEGSAQMKISSSQDDQNRPLEKNIGCDRVGTSSKLKLNFQQSQTSFENDNKNNYVSSSTENTPSECASSQASHNCSCDLSYKRDNTASVSSNGSCSISIAVQTVSTGDIMATQLYHDLNQKPQHTEEIQT